jgi:hypothetical protein
VFSRIAGRVVTGPVAFFVAGVIDFGEFALLSLWGRARRHRRRRLS